MEQLTQALTNALTKPILRADFQTENLHGGTLGDVQLISGTAETVEGEALPYKIVLKIQKKWERPSDPGSWRREYDFYQSDFGTLFTESFRWPECYLSEINADETETRLWLEYIEGTSGLSLTGEMYERAAEELGRFQGRITANPPAVLKNFTNLSNLEFMKNTMYIRYRSWALLYNYIRADNCEIPKHLCQMLIEIDENEDEIFQRIEKLPVILCHRDYWVTNIFYANDKIIAIDWDTAGWGYFGEDVASLVADEPNLAFMKEYFHQCIQAYYRGFSEYADISHIQDNCVSDLILVMYGYRFVDAYIHAESAGEKKLQIDTLQKIYEIRSNS